MSQFPFIVMSVIGVILLPFNTYNRNKQEQLESQLEDANNRISKLMVIEERQRIARDLHDTLGQKLSLIGLKSDLARRLVYVQPDRAREELTDIQQTARTALKEVREMVSNMRGIKLEEEIERVQQLLRAAEIDFSLKGTTSLKYTPLLVENVVSMCIKEAVTNVVKHSQATLCQISIEETSEELCILICDNGTGFQFDKETKGNGLRGIEERLDFLNGSLQVSNNKGTILTIRVPKIIKQEMGGS